MKFIFGVLLAMVASALAVNLQISSVTKQDSDGFVTFSFHPPAKDDHRALEVEMTLPGDVNEYTFNNCYQMYVPEDSFAPQPKVTRNGFATLAFSRKHYFFSRLYTYVCPFHAPNVVDYRQVGIYMRFDGQDYFASNRGGIVANSPLAKNFYADVASKYLSKPTELFLLQVPNINTPWTVRFGAPTDPAITTVVPVVFENINPSPTCDVAIGSGSKRVIVTLNATSQNGAIQIDLPAMTATNNGTTDYVLTCPDFIFNYPVSRSSVIEASRVGTGFTSLSFAIEP